MDAVHEKRPVRRLIRPTYVQRLCTHINVNRATKFMTQYMPVPPRPAPSCVSGVRPVISQLATPGKFSGKPLEYRLRSSCATPCSIRTLGPASVLRSIRSERNQHDPVRASHHDLVQLATSTSWLERRVCRARQSPGIGRKSCVALQ